MSNVFKLFKLSKQIKTQSKNYKYKNYVRIVFNKTCNFYIYLENNN